MIHIFEKLLNRARKTLLTSNSIELETVGDRIGDEFLLVEVIHELDTSQLLIPVRLISIENTSSICNNVCIGFYRFEALTLTTTDVGKSGTGYNSLWWLFEKDHFIRKFFAEDDILR